MTLESIDGTELDLMRTITVERNGDVITMSIDEILPSKFLWRVFILPYGCEANIAGSEISRLIYAQKILTGIVVIHKIIILCQQ